MAIPTEPQQEGGRWRYHRPTSEEVAAWFRGTTIHGDLSHDAYVGGVVIIPAQEKVKKQATKPDGTGMIVEAHEMTFTPYVRVDTRVAYAYDYAEVSDLVFAKEPVGDGEDGLPPGFWWLTIPNQSNPQQGQRYLCCSMRVAFYRQDDWFNAPRANDGSVRMRDIRPLRWGVATKQVSPYGYQGRIDDNVIAKAETGAVGRALGMAGILVVGTGIATAEDMQELRGEAPLAADLPELQQAESPEDVRERLNALSTELRTDHPEKWAEFAAWWSERQSKEGWKTPDEAPIEVRRGMVKRIETMLVEAPTPAGADDATGVEAT